MSEQDFVVGQRWVSNGEAELGLGLVKEAAGRQIEVFFPAVAESRFYAANNAPLSRVVYAVGDKVKTNQAISFTIDAVHELNGCFIYQGESEAGDSISIHEMDLDSQVQFNQPQERLFAGQVDKNSQFELRVKAIAHAHRLLGSEVYGLLGPRVQLLPHQMYIAHEVANRYAPRVLLADEVGLGKTIEAGLVIHQQLLLGHSQRVLIIVPDNLLHQWLVEMLRRFNLTFTLIDADRFEALTELDEGNPYDSAQLVLCGLSDLITHEPMQTALLETDWDMLVVDEAHHLTWNESNVSDEYALISSLAAQIKSLLLLTATPEQLGEASHFACLKLLDPNRYFDLTLFIQEQQQYQQINTMIELLDQDDFDLNKLDTEQKQAFEERLASDIFSSLTDSSDNDVKNRAIQTLLDQHGTGRVLFRNTRAVISGFPERRLTSYPLTLPEDIESSTLAHASHPEQIFGDKWLNTDVRIAWLSDWLKSHKGEKCLLICASKETAADLEMYLRVNVGVRSALFHEDMTLINRDRAAAYFADEEEGAQILICSEIGSEGRNFQFCHHLIMFDLPLNPDLLEQRIGRLDRIGQKQTVEIHVPYYQNSQQDILLDWYHRGMNAFERVFAAGGYIAQATNDLLATCLEQPEDEQHHQALITQTQSLTAQIEQELEVGRDKLLERNSFNASIADEIIAEIEDLSQTLELADFMDEVFEIFGIDQQTHSADSVILHPSPQYQEAYLPGLPEDGITATYQRHKALSNDDMAFLNWEHPMVGGALDAITHTEVGNSAFCTLNSPRFKPGTLLLEAIFVMKTVAAKSLQINRFLPQSYLRIVIDEAGKQHQGVLTEIEFNPSTGRIPKATAQELIRHARNQIGNLISLASKAVIKEEKQLVEQAKQLMLAELEHEKIRLQTLTESNPNIRQEEIEYLEVKKAQLIKALDGSKLSLDAIRVAIVTEPS